MLSACLSSLFFKNENIIKHEVDFEPRDCVLYVYLCLISLILFLKIKSLYVNKQIHSQLLLTIRLYSYTPERNYWKMQWKIVEGETVTSPPSHNCSVLIFRPSKRVVTYIAKSQSHSTEEPTEVVRHFYSRPLFFINLQKVVKCFLCKLRCSVIAYIYDNVGTWSLGDENVL